MHESVDAFAERIWWERQQWSRRQRQEVAAAAGRARCVAKLLGCVVHFGAGQHVTIAEHHVHGFPPLYSLPSCLRKCSAAEAAEREAKRAAAAANSRRILEEERKKEAAWKEARARVSMELGNLFLVGECKCSKGLNKHYSAPSSHMCTKPNAHVWCAGG